MTQTTQLGAVPFYFCLNPCYNGNGHDAMLTNRKEVKVRS